MVWNKLLAVVLRRGVRTGRLELTFADGSVQSFGPGGAPEVGVALHDPDLPRRFLLHPDLSMGEAYVDGRLTLRDDNIRSLITFAL